MNENAKDLPKNKPKNKFIEKLKSIKHIELIIALIFGVILILLYISTIGTSTKANETYDTNTVNGYINSLEDKVEDVLSNIKGSSNVSVVITLDLTGVEIDDDNQIINMTTFPPIKGVVVVAKGVDDTQVKLNIIKAIQALFGLSSSSVEIFLSK